MTTARFEGSRVAERFPHITISIAHGKDDSDATGFRWRFIMRKRRDDSMTTARFEGSRVAERFPHITISIAHGKDDSDATGDLNSLSVGFGVFQAWIFLVIFGMGYVFAPSTLLPSTPVLPEHCLPIVFDTFLLTLGACLLLLAFSNQLLLKFYVGKNALITATCLASMGTLLIYGTGLEPTGTAFAVVAGALMGMGASLMTVLWGTAFARYEFTTIILNTVVAIVIGVAVYLILIHWAPVPLSGFLACVLPIAASLILWKLTPIPYYRRQEMPIFHPLPIHRTAFPVPLSGFLACVLPIAASLILWKLTPIPYYRRQEMPIFHPLPIHRTAFVLRFGLPIVIFGFVLGALRHVCLSGLLPYEDLTAQLVIGAAACAGLAVIIATMAISKNESYWDMIFRCVLPAIALAVFCVPHLFGDYALLAGFFVIAGYICFETLMWFLIADLSQEFRLSPIFMFGLGRGLLELGSLIGSWLAQIPGDNTITGGFLIADLSQEFRLSPIFMFGLGRGLLELGSLIGSWLAQIPGDNTITGAFGNAEGALVLMLALAVAYSLLPRRREVRAIVDPNHVIKMPGYDALQTHIEKQQALVLMLALAVAYSLLPRRREVRAIVDPNHVIKMPGYDALQTHIEKQQIEDEPRQEADSEEVGAAEVDAKIRAKGRFHARCEEIADCYLLSRRETEVMFLLAKGHNAAFIQDKLCISKSTAKTHINHIYRKLDIHTQQELLNMVEDRSLDGEQGDEPALEGAFSSDQKRR